MVFDDLGRRVVYPAADQFKLGSTPAHDPAAPDSDPTVVTEDGWMDGWRETQLQKVA